MIRQFPVQRPTRVEILLSYAADICRRETLCANLRRSLRLITGTIRVQFVAFPILKTSRALVSTALHRFEESIGGRPYLIEAVPVSKDRWRAYIVRMPGVPTALMPFYGSTPDEAARHLSEWLTRAYARAAANTSTV